MRNPLLGRAFKCARARDGFHGIGVYCGSSDERVRVLREYSSDVMITAKNTEFFYILMKIEPGMHNIYYIREHI